MNGEVITTDARNKPFKYYHINGVMYEPKEIKKVAVELVELLKGRNLSYAEAEIILRVSLELLDTEAKL